MGLIPAHGQILVTVVPARPLKRLPLVQPAIVLEQIDSAKFPLWNLGMSLHLTASYIPCEAPT